MCNSIEYAKANKFNRMFYDGFRKYKGYLIAVIQGNNADSDYCPAGCVFYVDDSGVIKSVWRVSNTPVDYDGCTYNVIRKRIDKGVMEDFKTFNTYDEFNDYVVKAFAHYNASINVISRDDLFKVFGVEG